MDLHAGASGLQVHHSSGSMAIATVAVATTTPNVSNAVINLIIIRVLPKRGEYEASGRASGH